MEQFSARRVGRLWGDRRCPDLRRPLRMKRLIVRLRDYDSSVYRIARQDAGYLARWP